MQLKVGCLGIRIGAFIWTGLMLSSSANGTEPPVAVRAVDVAPTYEVRAAIQVTNQSVVTAGAQNYSQISGTDVEFTVTLSCALKEGESVPPGGATEFQGLWCQAPPGGSTPSQGSLEDVLLKKVEIRIGGETIVKDGLSIDLFPFDPGEKVKSKRYRFRMASTYFTPNPQGNLSPFSVVGTFMVKRTGLSASDVTADSLDLPVKIYNKALVFGTQEVSYEEEELIVRDEQMNELVPATSHASCVVANAAVGQRPMRHEVVTSNYCSLTKNQLVGQSGNPGLLRIPTFVFAMTHGIYDAEGEGPLDRNKFYGYRASYVVPGGGLDYPFAFGSQALKDTTIRTKPPGFGQDSEAFGAVVGSRTSPRQPPVNMAVMYVCMGMPLSDRSGLAQSFGIFDSGTPRSRRDTVCIGFPYNIYAQPGKGAPSLSEHVRLLLGCLKDGYTAEAAVKRMRNPDYAVGLMQVPMGFAYGDLLARIAYVYLTAEEWSLLSAQEREDRFKSWWYELTTP